MIVTSGRASENKSAVGAVDKNWSIVAATACGLAVSAGPVALNTFGVFLKPISEDTGWTRGDLSAATGIAALAWAVGAPFVGRLVDTVGPRAVILTSAIAFSVGLMSLYFVPNAVGIFVLWYAFVAFLGVGQSPVPYAAAISGWFDRRRGLALGLGLAGAGVGVGVLPSLAQGLISAFGWRSAFAALGAVVFATAVPAIFLLMRNPPKASQNSATSKALGLTTGAALRSFRFWIIGPAFFVIAAALTGATVHMVPLLSDRGLSAGSAAATMSAFGLALIVSRLVTGLLLDRFHASWVTLGLFIGPVIGLALLGNGVDGWLAVSCAFLVGIGVGAEFDILAYIVGRYFGLRAFGQIYALLSVMFALGLGGGPAIFGKGFDAFGSYDLLLQGGAVGIAISTLSMFCLGRYPEFKPQG